MSIRTEETLDHKELIDNPETLREWSNEKLLLHFLGIRFVIMTETAISSNLDRISHAIQVGRLEHEEILRRMAEGFSG